ncbi:hypothetical protein Dimus_025227, partial [Dionaea muscipula]
MAGQAMVGQVAACRADDSRVGGRSGLIGQVSPVELADRGGRAGRPDRSTWKVVPDRSCRVGLPGRRCRARSVTQVSRAGGDGQGRRSGGAGQHRRADGVGIVGQAMPGRVSEEVVPSK